MAFTGTISHEGDVRPPVVILDEAVHCAEQVRTQREALGAPRLMKSFDLTDGYQAYVLDMEHVWKIHIIPPYDLVLGEQVDEIDRIKILDDPTVTIAGLVSGGAGPTTLQYHSADPENGRPWSGYYVLSDAVSLMPETAKLFTRPEVAYKVGVPENPIFAPFDRVLSENIYSQFATTVPGHYTGAMSSIVQLLLGVGKVLEYDYEQRWLVADPKTRLPLVLVPPDPFRDEDTPVDVPTSFYSGTGEKEIQISYDHHWNRTHGVMWGRSEQNVRVPMLVELGQRGAFVMPFPVDELSKLPKVQAHYKKVYPDLERFTPFWDETAGLFEAFGGFPTGERMAGAPEELDRQVRAGWVIEADRSLAPFYSGMPMCTGFGWAFDDTRPRAINTMYKYNELGQKVGYCYEVRLAINEKPAAQKVRNTLSAQLVAALGLQTPLDIFKAERIDQDTAEALLVSQDYDAFDAYEVTPDWDVRMSLVPVREGVIDIPGVQCPRSVGNITPCDPIGTPHFKYYEPLLGVVLNFDFSTGVDSTVPLPPRSDGPIFATYVRGGPEILHMFKDHSPVSSTSSSWDTRQPCQFVGSWETGSLSERTRPHGYFYTSSRDYREDVSFGSLVRNLYTGAVHGNYDFMSFCAFFAIHCEITKRWIGSDTNNKETHSGWSFDVSVSCASNNRSVFFICREERKRDIVRTITYSGGKAIGDSGAIRLGSVYNFIMHWTGVCASPLHPPLGKPACVLVTTDPIIANPNACMGTDPPISPVYMVCCIRDGVINTCGGTWGQQQANEYVCTHPLPDPNDDSGNCVFIQSAAVTRAPTVPPYWTKGFPKVHHYKYEIRAFGHPHMHDQVIKEYEETTTTSTNYVSDLSWWKCSLPECPAYPWPVVANYYGPPYVGTNREFGFGWVEFGRKPQVTGRYFGVVY
jgi:hypothetical protein